MEPENHKKCIINKCNAEGMFVSPQPLSHPDEFVCYSHYNELVKKQRKKYYSLSSRFDRLAISVRVWFSMRILYFKIFLRRYGINVEL